MPKAHHITDVSVGGKEPNMMRTEIKANITWLRLLRSCAVAAACFLAVPAVAQADPPTVESVMTPGPGEKAGELASGELLSAALKKANCEGNSVRLAMQSIEKLFNFHMSHAGDRYVFRLGKGRRIEMLRYQRDQHVYEATLDPESGRYTARILELESKTAEPSVLPDEDGEIDVEYTGTHPAQAEIAPTPSAEKPGTQNALGAPDTLGAKNAPDAQNALGAQNAPDAQNAPSAQNAPDAPDAQIAPSGTAADDELLGLETADDDDPRLPEDSALAGRISPDELPDEDRPPQPSPVPPPLDEPQAAVPFEHHDVALDVQNTPFHPTARPRKPAENEPGTFASVSVILFVFGAIMALLAAFVFVVPGLLARRRCAQNGLAILDIVRISATQRIARVQVEGHTYLIAIAPESMSLIAPCDADDETWKNVLAKSYWQRMAGQSLTDPQLADLLHSIKNADENQRVTTEYLEST